VFLKRVLISGGGTGGHIYPALAIAGAIRAVYPDANIRFVGAEGRMEMEKVPQYGYTIDGITISGLNRKNFLKNLSLPFKLYKSLRKVTRILKEFKPQVVIGVGGYASGPLLRVAAKAHVPTLIQEQNSFPGITNKILAKDVNTICVAYPGLEKYFPANKIVLTGNPVRKFSAVIPEKEKEEAFRYFNLVPGRHVLLVIGGSLGARTINESVAKSFKDLNNQNIQLIWQTGKVHYENILENMGKQPGLLPFIDRMDYAYAIADVVISRAGAISISELAMVGKPVILVPSPNVAEDHQTKNALALVEKNAAIMVRDNEATDKLIPEAIALLGNKERQKELSENILAFAKPDAAERIVKEVEKIALKN